MIKRFILTILVVGLLSAAIIGTSMNNDYSMINIVDATFIVGILTFFLGLLMLTNATQVLKSTGFVLKQRFSRKLRSQYLDYYAYAKEHEKKREKTTGLPMLTIGFIMVVTDIILSLTVLT